MFGLDPVSLLVTFISVLTAGIIRGYRASIDRTAVGGGITIFVTVGLGDQGRASAEAFERAVARAGHQRLAAQRLDIKYVV